MAGDFCDELGPEIAESMKSPTYRAARARAAREIDRHTCCGQCPGGTCYVDQITGAASPTEQATEGGAK